MQSPEPDRPANAPLWRRRLLTAELAALIIVAAWAILFHARLPGRLPTEESFNAVASAVGSEAQPGDVVLLQPWWTEHARLYLPQSVPVVGYLHSDTEALEDAPRIWLLSQPHLPKAGTSRFLEQFSKDRTRIGEPRTFGNLELSLWKNGRYRPAQFSAAASLSQAHVYLEDSRGARAECPWNGRQHQCPQAGHLRVAREWHEVDQVPRNCMYMHAPGGDARLVAEFQNVPPGQRLHLEGGIIWEHAARVGDASDVLVEVSANGAPALSTTFKAGVEKFSREEAPSPAQPFTLKVAISSQLPTAREICLGVFMRSGAAP